MRRRFQFSLRALLAVFTAVCVWTGVYVEGARRQRDAVDTLRDRVGVSIKYDYERASRNAESTSPNPPFGAHLLGIDMVANVSGVMVLGWQDRSGVPFDDVDVAQIRAFPKLKHLRLDRTSVTDRGLVSLVGLRQLNSLYVRGSPLTENGISTISQLPRLNALILDLPSPIHEAAFAMLAQAPALEFLDLRETPITDSDLRQLARSASLKELHVSARQVTAAGVDAFRQLNSACKLKLRPDFAAAPTVKKRAS